MSAALRPEAGDGMDAMTYRTAATDRDARTPPAETGPMITAALTDGPLKGTSVEVQVVEGRPPKILEVPVDDGGTCRYCLADWVQTGSSAAYTFLYRV
jgi:hypothetical protein